MPNCYYFATKTFKEDPGTTPIKQFCNTYPWIKRLCESYCAYYHFCAEFTLNGRIHYHIMFRPIDNNDYELLEFQHKLKRKGHCDMQIMKGTKEQSKDYLRKSIDTIKRLLEEKLGYWFIDNTFTSGNAVSLPLVIRRYNRREINPFNRL